MEDIYKDTMSQREFMLAALQSDEDIKPRDVQAFWKQKKAVEITLRISMIFLLLRHRVIPFHCHQWYPFILSKVSMHCLILIGGSR